MKEIRKRLTYANVMSSLAVFLVLGGATALAMSLPKNSVGTKQLKNNAVTAAKVKKEAVTAAKIKKEAVGATQIKGGAVDSTKLAAGAVSNEKLGAGSVTSDKLTESERSQAFEVTIETSSTEFAHPLAEPPTTIATLNLPAGGKYVVTGEAAIIDTVSTEEFAFSECFLVDDATQIAETSDTYKKGILFPTGGFSLTGVSDGGTVTLKCKSNEKGSFGFERRLIATRVGSVS